MTDADGKSDSDSSFDLLRGTAKGSPWPELATASFLLCFRIDFS